MADSHPPKLSPETPPPIPSPDSPAKPLWRQPWVLAVGAVAVLALIVVVIAAVVIDPILVQVCLGLSVLLFFLWARSLPAKEAKKKNEAVAENNKGIELLDQKDWDSAIDCFSEAIRIDSTCKVFYYHRGSVYCTKGEFDKAIADFTKAIKLDPQYGEAYYSRGRAYGALGDTARQRIGSEMAKNRGYDPEQELGYDP